MQKSDTTEDKSWIFGLIIGLILISVVAGAGQWLFWSSYNALLANETSYLDDLAETLAYLGIFFGIFLSVFGLVFLSLLSRPSKFFKFGMIVFGSFSIVPFPLIINYFDSNFVRWHALTGVFIMFGIISLLFGLLLEPYRKKSAEMKAQLIKESTRRAKAEAERVRKLKASMTPGEWRIYQVQLENQRLLREANEIASKQQAYTGPRPMFGFFRDLGD